MFLNEMNVLVSQEQHRDRLRQAEAQRLVRAVERQAAPGQKGYRRMAGWLGMRLVAWGARLQRYGGESPVKVQSIRLG